MNKNLLYFYAGLLFEATLIDMRIPVTGEHCNRRIVILLTLLRYYEIVEINEMKINVFHSLLFSVSFGHAKTSHLS